MPILPESGVKNPERSTIDYGMDIVHSNPHLLNARTAMLLGAYEVDWGKRKKENIPSAGEKSRYSCERYQFFLDAPFEISHQCCHVMKKAPMNAYAKKSGRVPMTAQMASESRLRTQAWLKNGCNAFDAKKKISNPMAFWLEEDVLLYLYLHGNEMIVAKEHQWELNHPDVDLEEMRQFNPEWNRPICSVYGDLVKENEVEGQLDWEDLGVFDLGNPTLKLTGCQRTGCMLCGFGAHLEKDGESRFQRLHETHPGMYNLLDVVKNNGVTFREAIDWTNEHGNLHIRY